MLEKYYANFYVIDPIDFFSKKIPTDYFRKKIINPIDHTTLASSYVKCRSTFNIKLFG
jgi:hypothetical protein